MLLVVICICSAAILKAAAPNEPVAMYQSAERTRADKILPLALNLSIAPIWAANSDRFWMRLQSPDGWQYLAVDPQRRERHLVFDHARLAAAISHATGRAADDKHLMFDDPRIDQAQQRLKF